MEVNLIPITSVHLGRRSVFQKLRFSCGLPVPVVLEIVFAHCVPPLLSSPVQHSLTHPELTVAVEMLSSVALINRALESGDMNTVWKQLSSAVTGLTNIEEENCQRWDPEHVPWVRGVALPSAFLCLHVCFHSFQALCLRLCVSTLHSKSCEAGWGWDWGGSQGLIHNEASAVSGLALLSASF